MSDRNSERTSFIFGLRAIAAVVIVLHHTLSLPCFWSQTRESFYGGPTVAFFFVLSGFCLELGYANWRWTAVPKCLRFPLYFIMVLTLSWLLHRYFVIRMSRFFNWMVETFGGRMRRQSLWSWTGVVLMGIVLLGIWIWRDAGTEVQNACGSPEPKTDNTQYARVDVKSDYVFIHPGEAPSSVRFSIQVPTDFMEIGFEGQHGACDVMVFVAVDGKEVYRYNLKGRRFVAFRGDIPGEGRTVEISVDKNGALAYDGVVVRGPRFYVRENKK